MVALDGEAMVNTWLLRTAARRPPGPDKLTPIFDFDRPWAYKAALPQLTSDPFQETSHGRPFAIQEHHASQGPAGCDEVQAVRQAGARNHRCGQARHARSGDEPAAARPPARGPRRKPDE